MIEMEKERMKVITKEVHEAQMKKHDGMKTSAGYFQIIVLNRCIET
jgi:hypothetical protein